MQQKTQISIGGQQDRETLIEQSPNYSNRTFNSWISPLMYVSMHKMKCIDLFTRPDSSTYMQGLHMAILAAEMFSNSVLYHSNFPILTLFERMHHMLGCLNLLETFHVTKLYLIFRAVYKYLQVFYVKMSLNRSIMNKSGSQQGRPEVGMPTK